MEQFHPLCPQNITKKLKKKTKYNIWKQLKNVTQKLALSELF